MVISKFTDVNIIGISAAVSNNWTSLLDISEEDPNVVKKFIKKTGVEGRYNANLKQTASDFCFVAAKTILNVKQISLDEIGVLVFVTQNPDYKMPSTACILQSRLGLSKNCIAFDVNLGCSGFTYGLNIAGSLLKCSNSRKALILCGDTAAKERSQANSVKTSHSVGMLFGDCGTATLIELNDDAEPINMISKTDGEGFKAIIEPYEGWRNPDIPDGGKGGATMDDVAVFNFAISEVPDLLKETMNLTNSTPDDYDCLVLHQANLFIMKQVAKRTGFSMDKTLVSLDKFGNTSSASIPVSLVKEYGEIKEKNIHALMCGFGIGLSWSTVDCYISASDILPLIHTDEYFEDGYTPAE